MHAIRGSRAPEQSSGDVYLVLVLRQLAADAERPPAEFLDWAHGIFARSLLPGVRQRPEVLSWALQAFGSRLRDS
ncbi:hypothetical protein ACU635_29520 [[Actinomadura] parvosata]|uniref:hypothetical protein n=1 Tax=[Actinomadura] parvosata TaxID=1955412 RepID=UPI00406C70A7